MRMQPLRGRFRPVVEHLEARDCPSQLLPDLHVLPGYLHDWHVKQNNNGKTILRLSTAMANGGEGPFELRGTGVTVPDPNHPGQLLEVVHQRIYDPDVPGGFKDVVAGHFEYHEHHGHTHFTNFARNVLWAVNPDGSVGEVVAAGKKTSFCMLDIFRYDPDLPGSPSQASYQVCSAQRQGISVGWADIYSNGLPGQSIDITGVPSGQYWLGVVADPDDHIRETDETNNVTRILIDLVNPGPAPLRVRAVSVQGATDGPVPAIDVVFNKKVRAATFTPEDVVFQGPNGDIRVAAVTKLRRAKNKFRIQFPDQYQAGTYVMQVGPNIKSRAGKLMDQNNDGTPGQVDDHFLNIFAITAPRIISVTPGGADVVGPLNKMTLRFNKPIQVSSLTSADVQLLNPFGQMVAPKKITRIQGKGGRVFVIHFAKQQAPGVYELKVGPEVNDRSGNLLDQNGNGLPGEADDALVTTLELI